MADKNLKFLMGVHNKIEAENVTGILECEGIEVEVKRPGTQCLKSIGMEGRFYADIYVPAPSYDNAMEIIEVEMMRGDF